MEYAQWSVDVDVFNKTGWLGALNRKSVQPGFIQSSTTCPKSQSPQTAWMNGNGDLTGFCVMP